MGRGGAVTLFFGGDNVEFVELLCDVTIDKASSLEDKIISFLSIGGKDLVNSFLSTLTKINIYVF